MSLLAVTGLSQRTFSFLSFLNDGYLHTLACSCAVLLDFSYLTSLTFSSKHHCRAFYTARDLTPVNQSIQNVGNWEEKLYLYCFLVYLMLMQVVHEDWSFFLKNVQFLQGKILAKMILKKQLDFYEKVIWSNDMSAGIELKIQVICFSFVAHNPALYRKWNRCN